MAVWCLRRKSRSGIPETSTSVDSETLSPLRTTIKSEMTTLLNNRQQLAEAMTRELRGLEGAWVVSPLPLDDSKRLRVQIADATRNKIIEKIRSWGYEPVCVGVAP